MKTIPETFTRNGFIHSRIWRTGDVAVYARKAVSGTVTHFETVRIATDKGGTFRKVDEAGKPVEFLIEPGERYPTAEMWGERGWTYPDRDAAVSKAESLLNKASR